MSYSINCVANLASPGATVHGQLFDSGGTVTGSAITSGVVELQVGGTATGTYAYLATAADSFVGSLLLYVADTPTACAGFSLNPQETENADAKVSTRLSGESVIMTGKTAEEVLRNLWSVVVGDSAADDASNPSTITYDDATGSVDVTHGLTDTTRTVS